MDIYAQNILAHYKNPRHQGRLAQPTVTAQVKNPYCGDVIDLSLRLDAQGRVAEVAFTGQGCAISQAAMSLLSEELAGLSRGELLALARDDIFALLGIQIGPGRIKCALLGLLALRKALNQAATWREFLEVRRDSGSSPNAS